MLDMLKTHIKTNVAQLTQIFNIDTQSVTATLNSNVISSLGVADGEWTISGGTDAVASKGCVNQTFNVTGNQVVTNCFFGDEAVQVDLVAQKVNVGTAIARDLALTMLKDTKTGNSIIVYVNSARNISKNDPTTISDDLSIKVNYTLGVIFKIEATQMEELGCINTDIAFIGTVLGIGKDTSTLIKFENVKSRFFIGDDYCVDYEFSYEDVMELDDIIKARLKHFDTVFENLELN